MDKEQRLVELRKILELNKTGFAGILQNGNIVDRRVHPEAIPVQRNMAFGVVDSKPIKLDDLKLECEECWYMVNYEDTDKWGDTCGRCGRNLEALKKIVDDD